jgi:hypothetical protein
VARYDYPEGAEIHRPYEPSSVEAEPEPSEKSWREKPPLF